MALTCHFFTFSKKINSTAVPPQGTETSVLCELKAPTDIRSMNLMIGGSIQDPTSYNYCYVPSFSRFYFIENWAWDMGRWIAQCKVDVLASYRTTILASTQYVTRSASIFNGRIADTKYPMIANYDLESGTKTTGRQMTPYIENGYYVLGIIGITGSVGAVNYYLFTPSEFANLKRAMFNNVTWTGVSDPTMNNDLLKCFFSPFDYVVSCKWCPITNITTLISCTAVTAIGFGFWVFTVNAYSIGANAYTFFNWTWTVEAGYFSNHPQNIGNDPRGAYLKLDPYAEYCAALQPYGIFKIPSTAALNGIYCVETVDAITGHAYLEIFESTSDTPPILHPLLTVETEMFVDIQLAQVRADGGLQGKAADIGAGILQSIGGALADVTPFFDGLNNIGNIVRSQYENIKVGTANGSFADFGRLANFDMTIFSKFAYVTEDSNTHFGRPYCADRVLSLCSGFTMCAGADIAITGTDEEAAEINQFLNTGFYIE